MRMCWKLLERGSIDLEAGMGAKIEWLSAGYGKKMLFTWTRVGQKSRYECSTLTYTVKSGIHGKGSHGRGRFKGSKHRTNVFD